MLWFRLPALGGALAFLLTGGLLLLAVLSSPDNAAAILISLLAAHGMLSAAWLAARATCLGLRKWTLNRRIQRFRAASHADCRAGRLCSECQEWDRSWTTDLSHAQKVG